MACRARSDYVAGYGGMFASVPDELCDYRRFVRIDSEMTCNATAGS